MKAIYMTPEEAEALTAGLPLPESPSRLMTAALERGYGAELMLPAGTKPFIGMTNVGEKELIVVLGRLALGMSEETARALCALLADTLEIGGVK